MSHTVSGRNKVTSLYGVFVGLLLAGAILLANTRKFESVSHDATGSSQFQALRLDMQVITTVEQWRIESTSGNCIVFMNCNWNGDVVSFRRTFNLFAARCASETAYRPLAVKIDPQGHSELFGAVQKLWSENRILPGGLKNFGGAGRVVWLQDGRVVDYAWCAELHSVKLMKARTDAAFSSFVEPPI